MNINQYIFREYDVRGKVEDDFPPEVVESLGKAFGTFIKRGGGQAIALSGDIRLTTPDLIEQFKLGVLSTGVDVINIGNKKDNIYNISIRIGRMTILELYCNPGVEHRCIILNFGFEI